MALPRIMIAALRGGSGKTIVSVGLIASLRKRGMAVVPFKKGPDFIDAGWLALAAGHPCHNLDPFLMSSDRILLSFTNHTSPDRLAVIEGNRGLYDGIDIQGSTSTSELAKLLKTPVVLVIDCTKSTRTVAAMLLGCLKFDPEVDIAGVVLNRVAGARHESIVSRSIKEFCGISVLGAIPKIKGEAFPERHMGLVPTPEHDWADESIEKAAGMAEQYLDLDGLVRIAGQAPELTEPKSSSASRERRSVQGLPSAKTDQRLSAVTRPRIGVIRDAAFQFYYPENLEALEAAGAELVVLNAFKDKGIKDLDGLYIGGGFPETNAEALADNEGFRNDVRLLAEKGLPIYAECGGLIYLGESLILGDTTYPMAGVFQGVTFGFSRRPQGHGYTVFEVDRPNPYFEPGLQVRGHEFHYSKVLTWSGNPDDLAFRMSRGGGFANGRDGLCYKNTLATYSHVHAVGTPLWAKAIVKAAAQYRKNRRKA